MSGRTAATVERAQGPNIAVGARVDVDVLVADLAPELCAYILNLNV